MAEGSTATTPEMLGRMREIAEAALKRREYAGPGDSYSDYVMVEPDELLALLDEVARLQEPTDG